MVILDALFLGVIIIVAVYIAKKGETEILKSVLLALVVEAEKQYGDGTGATKLATVIDWLYQRIPLYLQPFFSAEELKLLVERAVSEAQSAWGNNNNLKEYIAPTIDKQ